MRFSRVPVCSRRMFTYLPAATTGGSFESNQLKFLPEVFGWMWLLPPYPLLGAY